MSLQSKFGYKKYDLAVRDQRALDGFSPSGDITSGCLVFVYDAGTKTLSTIYSDGQGTALANPITRTAFAALGKVGFYSASTSHDITVCHSDGSVGKYAGITSEVHVLPLNRDGADKMLVIPWVFNNAVETATGISLPSDVAVFPPIVEVVTTDATETIDIGLLSSGTNGDADGFIKALSIANSGYIRPWVITDGSSEDFVATPYLGALIGLGSAGTDAGNDFGQHGGYCHVVTGANEKGITYTCSSGSDTGAGYMYIPFKHLR